MDGLCLTGWPQIYDRMLWDLAQHYHEPNFSTIASQLASETRRDRFLRQCVHIDPDPFSRDMCKVHYEFLQRRLSAYRDQVEAERPTGFSIFDTSNLAVRLKSIYDQMKARIPHLDVDVDRCNPDIEEHGELELFGLEGAGGKFNPFSTKDDEFGEFRADFSELPECNTSDDEGDAIPAPAIAPGSEADDDHEFWTHTRLSIRIPS